MYRNNVGDRPPPKGLLGRLHRWLVSGSRFDWLSRLDLNSQFMARYGTKHQAMSSYDPSPWRSDPHPDLPHAELTEEEWEQAVEEIRRRPRIGWLSSVQRRRGLDALFSFRSL